MGLLFAANWKMHIGPDEARAFAAEFLTRTEARDDRKIWFFPPAVSIPALAMAVAGRDDILVGAQDVHWEPKGAFTGALSVPLAEAAGARAALVGHSERRHVFGETPEETGRKVKAILEHGMNAVLCVGEQLEERQAGRTDHVVLSQLEAGLSSVDQEGARRLVIAYEPVWAIGTGKNATPRDAAAVHRTIRTALGRRWKAREAGAAIPILYGGSVKTQNVADLVAEPEVDGVLVGGASLTAPTWSDLIRAGSN